MRLCEITIKGISDFFFCNGGPEFYIFFQFFFQVSEKQNTNENLQTSLNDMEAKILTISNTHEKQSNDLLDLQSKVDGILTEALASVELATSASQKNGTSPIDVEAIVRIQKFQAALDAEVQSRLQLEQKLEDVHTGSFHEFFPQKIFKN